MKRYILILFFPFLFSCENPSSKDLKDDVQFKARPRESQPKGSHRISQAKERFPTVRFTLHPDGGSHFIASAKAGKELGQKLSLMVDDKELLDLVEMEVLEQVLTDKENGQKDDSNIFRVITAKEHKKDFDERELLSPKQRGTVSFGDVDGDGYEDILRYSLSNLRPVRITIYEKIVTESDTYWLRVYCDMTRDGGGWTKIRLPGDPDVLSLVEGAPVIIEQMEFVVEKVERINTKK